MLDLTRIQGGTMIPEIPLALGVNPDESGLAFVRVADVQGNEAIKPSTGAVGEIFVGVAYLDKHAAATGVRVGYRVLVPASNPLSVTLPDQIGISNLKVVSATGVVAPAADYTLAGNVLTFVAGYASTEQFLSYNYTLSQSQLTALGISPVPSAASFLGKMAVLAGTVRVFVSNFDASADFAITGANSQVTLAADGMFSVGGATAIGHCFHVPTAQDPYLGVEFTTGK
jgi:hypothetical protein